MDEPADDHPERSKSHRERQISYDTAYMWNLNYNINALFYKTEADPQTESRPVAAKVWWTLWGRRGRLGLADAS